MGATLQVPSAGGYAPHTETSPNLARALFWGPYTVNGTRMTYMEAWARPDVPSGTPYPVPQKIIPVPPTWFVPDHYWPDDPNEWPPMQPKPDDPKRPVWPDTKNPPDDTFPTTRVVGDGDPDLDPDLDPKGERRPRYRRDPKPHEPWGPRDPKHDRRPRRKHEKENKFSGKTKFAKLAARLLQLASGTYGGITEVVDMVAAIYAALPDRLVAQDVNGLSDVEKLPHMLGMIWQHRQHIDMMEAMDNLAFNMIEDAAYGWLALVRNTCHEFELRTGIKAVPVEAFSPTHDLSCKCSLVDHFGVVRQRGKPRSRGDSEFIIRPGKPKLAFGFAASFALATLRFHDDANALPCCLVMPDWRDFVAF